MASPVLARQHDVARKPLAEEMVHNINWKKSFHYLAGTDLR